MNTAKKIILAAGLVLITIQFIQPVRNSGVQILATDISKTVTIPDTIEKLFRTTCYDCHSNNTSYPWYSYIQPVCWFLASHIKKAKDELNFSEFGTYSKRKQVSKLNGIANSIRDDIMPLKSYKIMHRQAQLSTDEKALLINWAQQSKDSLSVKN